MRHCESRRTPAFCGAIRLLIFTAQNPYFVRLLYAVVMFVFSLFFTALGGCAFSFSLFKRIPMYELTVTILESIFS